MTKAEKKKLINQILRLCEKQYRKGFQQGFLAEKSTELTSEHVGKWRGEGMAEGYKKVIDPISTGFFLNFPIISCLTNITIITFRLLP